MLSRFHASIPNRVCPNYPKGRFIKVCSPQRWILVFFPGPDANFNMQKPDGSAWFFLRRWIPFWIPCFTWWNSPWRRLPIPGVEMTGTQVPLGRLCLLGERAMVKQSLWRATTVTENSEWCLDHWWLCFFEKNTGTFHEFLQHNMLIGLMMFCCMIIWSDINSTLWAA